MQKLKTSIALATFGLQLFSAQAQQVPLKSVVEHFTNTKCSVCASRNPNFYTNYNSIANMLYLSIHPSSPYSSCFLSMQNKVINDARTNYYGIYGGTPRLVINGNVISAGADYASTSIFTPYLNLTSSFKINTKIQLLNDTFIVSSTIKKVDTSSLISATLFVGLIEDTINQNGGNGEARHYNVLRNANSIAVNLPLTVNDSITNSRKFTKANFWQLNKINSIVLLQNTTNKKLIQAETSKQTKRNTSAIVHTKISTLKFYPNPANSVINLNNLPFDNYQYQIISTEGKVLRNAELKDSKLFIDDINNGIYLLRISSVNNIYQSLVLIQH